MSNENKQDPLKGSIPIGTYENAVLNAEEIVVEDADHEHPYKLDEYYLEINTASRYLVLVSKDEVDTEVIIFPFESIVSISLGKVGQA